MGSAAPLRQIEEVIAIRRALEIGLIDKTLERIGEDDIKELRDTLEKMRQRAERGEGFPEEDRHFHQLLFRCQDNEVLLWLIEVFWLAFYKASDFRIWKISIRWRHGAIMSPSWMQSKHAMWLQ